jgi:cytochrome c-type biogenesis protein CcmH
VNRLVPLLAAAIAVAVAAAMALGAGRGPDPEAVPTPREVQDRVMSPYCPGLTLTECPSTQAVELRERVREKVEAGWTNREIDGWLVSTYGESVLGRPRGAASWLAPALAVALGAALLALGLARRARRAPEPEPSPPAPEERERLLADLRAFAEGGTE